MHIITHVLYKYSLKTEEYEGEKSPYKQGCLTFINIYHEFPGVFIYGKGGVQEGKSGKLIGKLQILVCVQFTVSDIHTYGSNKI